MVVAQLEVHIGSREGRQEEHTVDLEEEKEVAHIADLDSLIVPTQQHMGCCFESLEVVRREEHRNVEA
jgi:hypothetical protein